MSPKIYAEDLHKMEVKLEKLEQERARLENSSPLMRRVLKHKMVELDNEIGALGWEIQAAREHVREDPVSSEQYERLLAQKKQEREEAKKRANQAKKRDMEREPD
ncbi:hypothetical protein HEP89_29555 (plasmid) [Labrenzia sp. 5N]|uniref:hypothetical protein n=1 Tax=Labrenzia sp. 5N TaxID=2723402 RepID=UPI001446F850|nr:hypothetical protein [Labrenzia sp. 5N]NKX68286.1 hypothetical protein [Labrenzia sp. 5N]